MSNRQWPGEAELNTSLRLAAEWLQHHRIPGQPIWPVSAGDEHASVWGGTVDAVCAITALRRCDRRMAASLDDVDLADTKRWITTQQNKDGSFRSGEFAYAGAESTTWALIALHTIAPNTKDGEVQRGLKYLESCIDPRDGSVASTSDRDLPRTMPSALTLWAFALWGHRKDLQKAIVRYLLRGQDNASHGWGVNSSARPNPATTAQVLVAFQAADEPAESYELAVEYLIKQQRDSGRWPNSLDEWNTPESRTTPQYTNKCVNSGTAWALLALAKLQDHQSVRACRRAVRFLLDDQTTSEPGLDNGSWALWDDGAQRHVWLTAQIVVAVVAWREALPSRGLRQDGVRLRTFLLTIVDFLLNRAPLISTLGVIGAVLALSIDTDEAGLRDRLVGDGVTFRQSLLTSGLGAALLGAISWVFRGARNWRSRRRK